jgi:hypothetical protein
MKTVSSSTIAKFLLASIMLALTGQALAVNLVTNGSFENPITPTGLQIHSTASIPTGWTIASETGLGGEILNATWIGVATSGLTGNQYFSPAGGSIDLILFSGLTTNGGAPFQASQPGIH